MTSYYSVGTVTLVTGSKTVSGTGTAWQTALITGGNIIVEAAGNVLPIASVDDDDTITAELAWTGASGTYNYAIQRDTAYLKTLDTNSQNLAYLLSELRQGTIFKYDVTGPESDRNIYDAKPKGFAYLSTDGTNPQLYVKLSATSGDWAGPFAYGTGPVGPAPTLAVASTNTLSPGSSATVSITGSDGDYGLTFGIPAGLTGINNRGTYAAGTAYAVRDGVLYNGSYWYATQATTGNAPPASASTTSNTWWQLVAAKGTDGTGTGDMSKATYDPQNKNADAFNRENHTGTNTPSDGTVTTPKIANSAVTQAKLASDIVSGWSAKTSLVDADQFLIGDSAASSVAKKLTWANVKSTLLSTVMTWTGKQTFQSAAFTTNPVDLTIGQIKFPAAQASSSDVNTLDDYEEGTWTPIITQGNTIATSVNSGTYTKIGRNVALTMTATFSGAGTASNAIVVSGLPFSPVVGGTICVGTAIYFDAGTQYYTLAAEMVSGGSVRFVANAAANNFGLSPAVTAAVNDRVSMSFTYEAAT